MTTPKTNFQLLFESSPEQRLVLAPDLTVLAASDGYLRAVGISRQVIIGKSVLEILGGGTESASSTLRASFERVLHLGVSDEVGLESYRGRAAVDNEAPARPCRIVNAPIPGDDSLPAYILHHVEEVAEPELSNRRLQASCHDPAAREASLRRRHDDEDRFRRLVDAVRDYAIFMLDPAGSVATWNAGAHRLTGYEAAEIIGQHFSRFHSPEDVRRGLPRQELETARAIGRFSGEDWRCRKDGTRFWANVIITAVFDEAGELLGFSEVTRDCTEQRRAEESVRELSTRLARTNRDLERQNSELVGLQAAALAIHGELALDAVLQKVVEQARLLIDSRYGALSVMNASGGIVSFVTSGVGDQERAAIGSPPHGHGLLGVVLHEGQRLRLPDITRDPRTMGFPPNHPPMHSLLAVPVPCKGPFRGNLYLSERVGVTEFSAADEETLVRFAITAAIAIDNADLHRRLRSLAVAEERVRIAHELHDGTAQVLAYVGVKAQAVREYLRQGRTAEAEEQLEELRAAAHNLQVETREAILGLRTPLSPDQPFAAALRHVIERWQDQSGTPSELIADEDLQLDPEVKLQLLRIVQEALANVRKHARASRTRVELRRAEGSVTLSIEDDGVGFAAGGSSSSPGHFGLSTMRERASRMGGVFHLDTSPGHGTRLWIQVPESAALPPTWNA